MSDTQEEAITPVYNNNLVLLCGKSGTGKSASLRNLRDPEGVVYINCESGKQLPFRNKFKKSIITDPMDVYHIFDQVEEHPEIHTIVIDSITFLMDMFETKYVIGSADTMKGWSQYAQYVKKLMQYYVAKSTKSVIIIAHTADKYNDSEMVVETAVPIKGSTSKNGLESYFSVVIAAKKVPLKMLEKYKNPLLTITEEEETLGFKHVFQARITKETVNERLRGPMGMFSVSETYLDNDMQNFKDLLHKYYNE